MQSMLSGPQGQSKALSKVRRSPNRAAFHLCRRGLLIMRTPPSSTSLHCLRRGRLGHVGLLLRTVQGEAAYV